MLELDFVDEYDSFGVTQQVELKPDGANIAVTESNKLEYIRLLCEHRLKGRVEQQVTAFKKGLHEIVKPDALAIFDERELEVGSDLAALCLIRIVLMRFCGRSYSLAACRKSTWKIG